MFRREEKHHDIVDCSRMWEVLLCTRETPSGTLPAPPTQVPILTLSPTSPVLSPSKRGSEEEMNGFAEETDLDIDIKTAVVTSAAFTKTCHNSGRNGLKCSTIPPFPGCGFEYFESPIEKIYQVLRWDPRGETVRAGDRSGERA